VVTPLLRGIAGQRFDELPEERGRPIRVVWAERDRVLPFAHYGLPLLQRLPGAELVRTAGIGHVPMWDDPAEVARLTLEVTAAVDAAATAAPAEPEEHSS
jgi:pimeloyl-ACP methyl ester carboxylesterase